MDLVSLKKSILLPGNVDFTAKKNNLISNHKEVNAEVVLDAVKSQAFIKEERFCGNDNEAIAYIDEEEQSLAYGDAFIESSQQLTIQESIDIPQPIEQKPVIEKQNKVEANPNVMVELSDCVEKAKKILFEVENDIVYLYEGYFANRGFAYTAKEVVVNLEEYLQSLFLVVLMTDRDIQEEEMRFIWSVLSHADIFTGMDSIEGCFAKAKQTIIGNPYAIMISVAVDKFYDKQETKGVINRLYSLYEILCLLAGVDKVKKGKLFENIISFAQAQGVKIL